MATEYEYDVEMKTEWGWEIVDCQPTLGEAKTSRAVYIREQPGYEYRVKKVRVQEPVAVQ